MAEERTTPETPSFLEDVPTRFEGGRSVLGVPMPKMISEPLERPETAPAPDFLEDARPGFMDRAKEAAIGAMQGATRDAPVVAGGLAGARFGLATAPMVAPALGPLAPLYPAATTLIGLGAGYFAGQEAERFFPAVSREDLVPYREGGKTFGSSIATAPVAFGLPVMTGNRVARFLSGVGEQARRNPGTFMLTEGISAGSMGVAGGGAESYFPGQEGVRLGAELAGGFSGKLLLSGVDAAKSGIRTVQEARQGAGRTDKLEGKAANLLLEALEKHGADPEALIKALRRDLPSSVPTPTAGQKTGSQPLLDLEASLAAHHAEFGGQTQKQGRTAMLAYQELINRLEDVGDPQLFKVAAQLRDDAFRKMLDNRLSAADAKSAAAIAKISRDTPAARAQIGGIVKEQTEIALREARDYESELWSKAIASLNKPSTVRTKTYVTAIDPKYKDYFVRTGEWPKIPIVDTKIVRPSLAPSATSDAFLKRAANVGDALYDDAIPGPVRRIMEAFGVDKDAVTRYKLGQMTEQFQNTGNVPTSYLPKTKDVDAGELVNYRSTLLKMAREAAGKGESNNADFYGSLAEGMLTDLSKLGDRNFEQARSFSRALNDVFTRTFASTASETGSGAVTRTGAQRLPAEILVTRAFGTNADVTSMRMGEIEDAVKFMRTQYDDAVAKFGKRSQQAQALKPYADAAADRIVSINDAQKRVLLLLASKAVAYKEVDGGRVVATLKPNELLTFAQQNAPLLQKLGLMDDLRDASRAANLLTQVTNENSAISKMARNQAAFAQALSAESPTTVINDALNSRFPVKSISNLTKLAVAGGTDAVNGLKSSLLDYAYVKAGGNSGKFNIAAYEQALFDPIAQNQPSLIKIMRDNGLMTLTEVKNMKRLITPMARVETAMKNNVPFDDIIQGADAATELAMRVVGAKLGTSLTQGGSSLIAASAGSKAVRQIFDNLPNMTVRQILENAVKDPEAMAILLERGRTQGQGLDVANTMINFLGKLGVSVGKAAITPALNYIGEEEPRPSQFRGGRQEPLTPEGQASRMLRNLPPAPSTRGVPFMQQPPAPAKGAEAPPSGAPTNANARSMMQSLFPFDTIAGLAAQQPTSMQ